MISNKDLRVEASNLIINGEKHPLDPAIEALTKRANIVQGKFSALDTKLDAIEALEKTASGNPISLTGVAAAYAMGLSMTIEPIQDLHGYSKPWAGGGGKNLLPMTVDGIKAANTIGTWSGNTYTHRNVTFTILTDSDDNVIGIKATGTASGDSPSFYLAKNISLANGNYILNGCPANGSVPTYCMIAEWAGGDAKDLGSGISLSVSGNTIDVRIRIQQNYAITSGGITFYPMLRLSTETDSTFAPYSNICPISGLTSGEVQTTNGEDTNTATITLGQTVYGGSVNFKTGEVTVTHANIASYNGESINDPWLSSLDKYESGATPTTGAQVVYPLSTPTTLTLTPAELELLKGNNTVSGNGGNINIGYIGR